MTLTLRFPAGADIDVARLLHDLAIEPPDGPLVVGDERVVEFLVAFGRRLLAPAVARRWPELGSLGFFLRRGEIAKSVASLADPPDALRVPRGLIFHVPPANVDTIFVYSWALAALAGNRNVVRVSSRAAGAAEAIVDALNATLADGHPAIRQTQRMVTYGRHDGITAALCAACDLRVIWGGDGSVQQLRQYPLPPSARDLTFPDRSSYAVLSAYAWQGASDAQRRAVAEALYNDVYWFDQAACASPRTVFWVGPAALAQPAAQQLTEQIAAVVADRGRTVDASMAVQKQVATYGLAVEGDATRVRFAGNAVAVVELARPDAVPRHWLGAGTFAYARVDRLTDLVPLVARRDQTITHYGFDRAELVEFARALNGRGVDRLVPIGRALTFARVWDGYDLLREFTRLVTIEV